MNATLHTRTVTIIVSETKAAQSAARHPQPRKVVDAPRGRKGHILEMAAAIRRCRNAYAHDRLATPISARLVAHKLQIAEAEIAARGLDTPAGWDELNKTITDSASHPGYYLVSGEGWYEYSRRAGSYHQSATYLIGTDEGQRFAVRVPSTIDSVSAALEWLKPAAIKQAEAKGLPTKRQGDIFFRPVRISGHDMDALAGTRHQARARKDGGLTIVHPEHRSIVLSGKHHWRAYASTQIASNGRRAAD